MGPEGTNMGSKVTNKRHEWTNSEPVLTWYLMSPSLDIVRHHEGERICDHIISAKSDRD